MLGRLLLRSNALSGRCSKALSLILYPVVHVIVFEAIAVHCVFEELSAVLIVGLLIETKISTVHQIVSEDLLLGDSLRQLFHSRRYLLLFDPIILIILVSAIQPLPWQRALQEVKQHIAYGLHVIPSRLLNAQMCVH